MAWKSKTKEIASAEIPMKERLQATISSLDEQLKASVTSRSTALVNLQSWNDRVAYAQEMIAGTDDPDALEALGILEAQAKGYVSLYETSSTEDDGYIASLETQLAKLKETLSSLDLIEKKKELNEHLRSISSGMTAKSSAKDLTQASGTAESREIDNLIHTAKALIELKSDKS